MISEECTKFADKLAAKPAKRPAYHSKPTNIPMSRYHKDMPKTGPESQLKMRKPSEEKFNDLPTSVITKTAMIIADKLTAISALVSNPAYTARVVRIYPNTFLNPVVFIIKKKFKLIKKSNKKKLNTYFIWHHDFLLHHNNPLDLHKNAFLIYLSLHAAEVLPTFYYSLSFHFPIYSTADQSKIHRRQS